MPECSAGSARVPCSNGQARAVRPHEAVFISPVWDSEKLAQDRPRRPQQVRLGVWKCTAIFNYVLEIAGQLRGRIISREMYGLAS